MSTVDAGSLRRAFDRSFALPVRSTMDHMVSAITVRVGDDPYVIRAADINGLLAKPAIVDVPSSSTSLLGIVGVRGALVPVFDLAVLLGYGAASAPAWLVLAGGTHPVGLGLQHFDAHVLMEDLPDHEAHGHLGAAVELNDAVYRLILIPSLLDTIRNGLP